SLTVADFMTADEVFVTGNIAKVMPVARLDDRHFQPGPMALRARELYWDFAHGR
ncbi:MAG TPA: branched chain amino acid aminotransferase, partial [Rhodobacteraceae bacterium]|nr:branched chain amino acid aminotransferase [Paracoccaceae bacterium]